MFRKSSEPNNGMLLVFKEPENLSFLDEEYIYSLDMIFIDNGLRIVDIKENVQRCIHEEPCPSYTSTGPASDLLSY
jgi:uncharacterized membrane protein (UPF0127 family)